jgi:ATP-dependent DNA ligase
MSCSTVPSNRVRLIARGGHDWTKRYPWIVEAALSNSIEQFVIDGKAVMLGVDGVSDFNALHSGKRNDEVQLYTFDILSLDGDDLRALPLAMRKASLERLLARRPKGNSSTRSSKVRLAGRPDLVSRVLRPSAYLTGCGHSAKFSVRPF